MLLLNIWGRIATVPSCSSAWVVLWPMFCHTGMLCLRHATPSQNTDTGPTCRWAFRWCWTSHRNTQLPILMSWVRPSHTHQRMLNFMMVVVSQKPGRKCIIPTGSWNQDQWCANPLCYQLAYSCFSYYTDRANLILCFLLVLNPTTTCFKAQVSPNRGITSL